MKPTHILAYGAACLAVLAAYFACIVTGRIEAANFVVVVTSAISVTPNIASIRRCTAYRFNWLITALGLVVWGVSDLVWSVIVLIPGGEPERFVPLMYSYVVLNACLVASIAYIAVHRRNRESFPQFIVDFVALLVGSGAFLWYVFFRGALDTTTAVDHAAFSSQITLVLDVLLVTIAAAVFLSFERSRVPLFLKIAFVACLAFVAVDVAYIHEFLTGTYTSHGLIDALYILCILALGGAAALHLDGEPITESLRSEGVSPRGFIRRSALLLLLPACAAATGLVSPSELVFFLVVALAHQTTSLFLRRIEHGEASLREKARRTELLEATIADRTRELRTLNQTLENLLKRDAITGQFNRKYFLEKIDEWIQAGDRAPVGEPCETQKVWLLILDFDRFKTVNDSYGHDVGDQSLRVAGKRLEALSNDRTVFARLGGDEFGFICRRCPNESVDPLVRTIADLVSEPIKVGAFTIHLSVSVGASSWPDDALTRSDLMRHADIALYIAKRKRGDCVSYFDSRANAGVERSHQIDLALGKANFDREFTLVYQPQITVGGRRLVGMEALVRWSSPELGDVRPDEFIPIAEENGVIIPLSDWIMEKALTQISAWNRAYGRDLRMGINVSPLQLDDTLFLPRLEETIRTIGAKCEWVNLEFTERSAMKDELFIVNVFKRLSELGIVSSMDDFGTGYSSLSYLKRFEIDYLKIAKQLIDGIATSETEREIVQAIIMMATALGLRTIAEGVEEEEQLRRLEALGCDEIQGYYFGKPVPPEEFEELFLKG